MRSREIEDVRFSSSAVDDFFSPVQTTPRVASTGKIRVANLRDLINHGFSIVAEDKLVRLSQQDFWQLGKDDQGHYIERLVDDANGPVKG